MDNKEFNERRHNRKKQECRFRFGIQQLWNYPIINLLWILFAGGVVLMVITEKRFVTNMEIYPLFKSVFSACMTIMLVIFPVICAIGLIQFVGFCFAIRDEADMEIVFGDKRDVKNQSPILYYKKRDRKSGVTKREFYTTINQEIGQSTILLKNIWIETMALLNIQGKIYLLIERSVRNEKGNSNLGEVYA